jgi:copper chaperone CopZ
MQKKAFHVAGMHCPNCAMAIEGLEDDLEGIVSIRVNYAKALMEIEFDEEKADLSGLIERAARKGYSLTEP